jgi:AAA15 family ATPase/GTPase
MLIEFSVTNFKSICARQTLNMAATTNLSALEAENTFVPDPGGGLPRLLRSTVLYGPNASGKSTLVQTLQ